MLVLGWASIVEFLPLALYFGDSAYHYCEAYANNKKTREPGL